MGCVRYSVCLVHQSSLGALGNTRFCLGKYTVAIFYFQQHVVQHCHFFIWYNIFSVLKDHSDWYGTYNYSVT